MAKGDADEMYIYCFTVIYKENCSFTLTVFCFFLQHQGYNRLPSWWCSRPFAISLCSHIRSGQGSVMSRWRFVMYKRGEQRQQLSVLLW